MMGRKKAKWLIYTVLVGLIPILSRTIAWFVTKDGTLELLAPSDFVALGLILHVSNINEIEHIIELDQAWKTIQNGVSIAFIAFYSVLFTLALVGKSIVNINAITYCTMAMAFVSFLISYSVYDRITDIQLEVPEASK